MPHTARAIRHTELGRYATHSQGNMPYTARAIKHEHSQTIRHTHTHTHTQTHTYTHTHTHTNYIFFYSDLMRMLNIVISWKITSTLLGHTILLNDNNRQKYESYRPINLYH